MRTSKSLCTCFYLLIITENILGTGKPMLTSVNFRSFLEWKTEEKNCHIQLSNGTKWLSLSVPVQCENGSCITELSHYITDIYLEYQAKVNCLNVWNNSSKMQLYRDVKVGPPMLNISLGFGQLNISVMLPLASTHITDGKPKPVQSIISNLGSVEIIVTRGNTLWNKETVDIKEDNIYNISMEVPQRPGENYCVSATPKKRNSISVNECKKAPEEQITNSVIAGILISIIIAIMVFFSGILIIRRYRFLTFNVLQPKVLVSVMAYLLLLGVKKVCYPHFCLCLF
ncbi:Hypothetical predicted protein [Pelobates cultripes]|uniref:Uncharacterized protein n=1 Tax=Pelobates cultripes TaxID=61616 RepID=A0AAD1T171_PELCU|nr:Hypothetical predicted protein [Pelobates cultripes]